MPTAQRRHAGHHQPGRQTASGRTSPRQAPATRTHRTSQAPQTPGQANRTVGHRGSRWWGARRTSRRPARGAICCCRYPGEQPCWAACCARTAVRRVVGSSAITSPGGQIGAFVLRIQRAEPISIEVADHITDPVLAGERPRSQSRLRPCPGPTAAPSAPAARSPPTRCPGAQSAPGGIPRHRRSHAPAAVASPGQSGDQRPWRKTTAGHPHNLAQRQMAAAGSSVWAWCFGS